MHTLLTVSVLPLLQVMELAQGGSLLDYVRQRKRLAEPEACFFLQQIVHGLMHCHDMEVSISCYSQRHEMFSTLRLCHSRSALSAGERLPTRVLYLLLPLAF